MDKLWSNLKAGVLLAGLVVAVVVLAAGWTTAGVPADVPNDRVRAAMGETASDAIDMHGWRETGRLPVVTFIRP